MTKVKELVDIIEDNEFEAFEFVMKNHKRKSLLKLFRYLKSLRSGQEPVDEKAFKIVTGSGYKKSDDYLLRNEYRLLSQAIGDFLAERRFRERAGKSEIFKAIYYLEELSSRNLDTLFFAELRRTREKLNDMQDAELELRVNEIEFQHRVLKKKMSVENTFRLQEILDENNRLNEILTSNRFWYQQSLQAYTSRMQWQLGVKKEYNWNIENTTANAYQYFHYLKSLSYVPEVKDKLRVFREMEKFFSQVSNQLKHPQRELAVICANMAIYLMIDKQFDASIHYFEKTASLKKYLEKDLFATVMFNYTSTLLRAGRYAQAFESIIKNEKVVLKNETLLIRWNNIKAMCYIMHEKAHEVKDFLPPAVDKNMYEDYIYHRVIQTMILFEKGKLETCENEAQNMMQTLRKKNDLDMYINFCKMLIEVCRILSNGQIKKSEKDKKLKTIDEKIKVENLAEKSLMPMVWLKERIADNINI